MPTTNDIILRPRFKIELALDNESVLQLFKNSKNTQSEFIVSTIDDHVFIKFPKHKQHFWSPQLHLEINAIDNKSSILHGLFGPNPTVWTFFMFIHFLVAGLFIAFGIWAYTNWALNSGYAIQITLMLFMVIAWFALYVAGSIGKATSKNEMLELRNFMNSVLEKESLN
ncbi:GTP-binding protein [Mariniflexile sp.]|uniref:GTP-binding protein n=1 Tax=Mariniflexile sp. TaxID=1979402 RepID=UPI003567EE68